MPVPGQVVNNYNISTLMEDLRATCLPPVCWYNWHRYVNVDEYPAILVFKEAGAR